MRYSLLAGLVLISGLVGAAPNQETSSALLQRAYRLTAQHKLNDAETLYHDLARTYPDAGYPALARFLARSGNTTAALQLVSSTETAALRPLIRARVAVAADLPRQAVVFLGQPQAGKDLYEAAVLLANTLEMLGRKAEIAPMLSLAVREPDLPPEARRDLFRKLARAGDAALMASTLPLVIDQLVTSSSMAYGDLRLIANDGLNVVAGLPAFNVLYNDLKDQSTTSPVCAWLLAVSDLKRGDGDAALAVLKRYIDRPITDRQKIILYEEAARLMKDDQATALKLYCDIIPIAPDPDRLRVVAAHLIFTRDRDYAKVCSFLDKVNPASLENGDLQRYSNLRIAAAAGKGGPSAAIDAYEQVAARLAYARKRELAEAPLTVLTEPRLQEELRAQLEQRLKQTSASADLWILMMSTQNALQNPKGIAEALQAYCKAHPEDMGAVQELSDAAANLALGVGQGAGTTTAPGVIKQDVDAAARELWEVVQRKPYEPESYGKLMQLYKSVGEVDKAVRVPDYLTSDTADAEMVHLAAYICMQNGYPDRALPLYERALKAVPNQPRFRVNYAYALARVGRPEEAEKILRDLIRNGYNRHQFHVHEVYDSAFRIAQQQGKTDDFVAFLKALIPDESVPQHSQFLLDAGKTLVQRGKPDDGIQFFEALIKRYPDRKDEAGDAMIQASIARRDFAGAEKLIGERDPSTTDPRLIVDKRYNLGELRRAQGNTTAAIEMWSDLARQYPTQPLARRGMLQAAKLMADNGMPRKARKLLEQLLSMQTGDLDAELAAREMLAQLKPSVEEEAQQVVSELVANVAQTTAPAKP